jgi:aryl-alcohol dehydrogenase-like predicted oxidoreductase
MPSSRPKRNRREFLSQASLALASGMVALPHAAAAAQARAESTGRAVIQRTLGRTGLTVPIVSMGVMNANNPELLKQAYDAGVRLFDTAQGYQGGRNERMIGDVVSQLGVRDKVVIQTKIRFPRVATGEIKSQLLTEFAGCLERLQTKYVDILLVHNPSVDQMNDPGLVAALQELKRQKTARFIGVSQHSDMAGVLRNAAETGTYDVVLTSFNVTHAEDGALLAALKAASAKGVGVIAMKTQTGGRGRNLGTLNHTALLKWALQHPEVATAIPGFTNADQLAESFSVAAGLDYTPEEKAWLADKSVRASLDYCRQCGTCLPTCPHGADIPALMRTHMYAANYANFELARATFEEIPPEAGLRLCEGCTGCVARCGHDVRIGQRVADLKAMYA